MSDQATDLRKLVMQVENDDHPSHLPRPRFVVLSGAKGGVGTTTLSVNLAVALGELGSRVVLVDADMYRADVAVLCGLSERHNVADVIAARRDIHEVLQLGPAGIQVVPGLWAPGTFQDCLDKAQLRLIRQFEALGRHADVIILDTGSGANQVVQRFWSAADQILLVSTPDTVSVMDAYATIKTLQDKSITSPISLLVNRCQSQQVALDVHLRVDRACQHFLGISTVCGGYVPEDDQVKYSTDHRSPFVSQEGPAAVALQAIASRLVDEPSQIVRAA